MKTFILGAAICALAHGATAASSAQAAETTAYTCVATSTTESAEFRDAHCAEEGMTTKTNYRHEPIGEDTQLTLHPLGTQALAGESFGAPLHLESTDLECVGCMVENTGGAGKMGVVSPASGAPAGQLRYEGVTAPGSGCTVEPEPSGENGVVTTKPLKFERMRQITC